MLLRMYVIILSLTPGLINQKPLVGGPGNAAGGSMVRLFEAAVEVAYTATGQGDDAEHY